MSFSPVKFTRKFYCFETEMGKRNEPELFNNIHKIMLPGDYIAMKLTGQANTTVSGLSEGIFWDFKENSLAGFLLDYLEIDKSLILILFLLLVFRVM